jgi:predicted transcriptional regulator
MPKTPPRKKTIAISVDMEHVLELNRLAELEDRPVSRIVREALDLGLPAIRRRHGIADPSPTLVSPAD